MCFLYYLFWFFLLALLPSYGLGLTKDNQSLAEIQEVAHNFVLKQARSLPGNIEVTPGSLDRRLRLPKCSHPLKAFFPSGSRPRGNTTVGVRCTGETPWTVYLSVKMAVYGKVLVATHAISSGFPLSLADLRLERRDLSELRQGYLNEPAQAVGKRLKRPVGLGAIITPGMLEIPKLIRRGQQVILMATAPGLQVNMKGQALEDAGAGEHIRVRNTSSRRIVEGTVTAAGLVQVQM
ncbi:flagellar basal body P-ring formation chaperone FlgA [Nitrosococcus oceani]|uniref:flagellar basal body P-ring formation chaperone FlgA n=1 Tax=Nitrosococcus oceani TaxID=1229 RepID=UPI0004E91E38|nr:flagellar basal body P-ring formation chaperone FlgA [Nitrosococcus oceani]KFI21696.1 flagellar basal body P-ring biosynthesis protein FlgA [Nitrosococcus oceani]